MLNKWEAGQEGESGKEWMKEQMEADDYDSFF